MMWLLKLPTLVAVVYIGKILAQSNVFVCVPAENCITANSTPPGSGIDVRIVTPVSYFN